MLVYIYYIYNYGDEYIMAEAGVHSSFVDFFFSLIYNTCGRRFFHVIKKIIIQFVPLFVMNIKSYM